MRQWIWRHYICGERSLAEVGVRSFQVSGRVWQLDRYLAKFATNIARERFGQMRTRELRYSAQFVQGLRLTERQLTR